MYAVPETNVEFEPPVYAPVLAERHRDATVDDEQDHEAERPALHRRRADLRITMGTRTFLVDVSVTHPLCDSYLQSAAASRGAAAAKRQAHKKNIYATKAAEMGVEFVGFAVETFGTLSDDATKFLQVLAAYYSKGDNVQYSNFMRWARCVLSVGLQRGNSRVMCMGR